MNTASLPVLAGSVSTLIFAASTLPMLVKAGRTKDLTSYSLGNILLANVGNAVHSLYVFHLPPGPIWVLHSFYLLSTAVMLFWYLRYSRVTTYAGGSRDRGMREITHTPPGKMHDLPDAEEPVGVLA